MRFDILTIFPNIFDSYLNESIIKRALESDHININVHDIRLFSNNRHKTVDDAPYGGGVGMVMKIEPLYSALQAIQRLERSRVILLSPRGSVWDQSTVRQYTSAYDQLILICGRYEGIDERIMEFVDEEISIGNYVLTGGELPALVVVDSISRLLPGVLGKDVSSQDESHSAPGYIEYPHYTRPEVFTVGDNSYKVPDILLSGNHALIEEWRKKNARSV